ncbi:N-methyltransferase tcpN [Paramyrothecium foliicola]|nr:N-methyltransferase tcpN [Paramyrothecium foliicola]
MKLGLTSKLLFFLGLYGHASGSLHPPRNANPGINLPLEREITPAAVAANPDPLVDEFYLKSTGPDGRYLKPIEWWRAIGAHERNMVLTSDKAEATKFKLNLGNHLTFTDSIGHEDWPLKVTALINQLPSIANEVIFLTEEGSNGLATNANGLNLFRLCSSLEPIENPPFIWQMFKPEDDDTGFDLKVADVATGNGIWLHDFAQNKPTTAEFHGFDISLDQVGPTPWIPANIHYHTWNIFDEPPERFLGYFDIVHVRLITVVVKNNDPRPVIENLTKLLKPGGYLQWDEVDTIGCSIKTVPGRTAENLDALFSQLKGRDTWKYELTNILDESGYMNTHLYTYEYGLGMARFWSDVYVSTWKEFADNVLKTPEVSNELERRAMIETRNGAAIMVPKLIWVAKKAEIGNV